MKFGEMVPVADGINSVSYHILMHKCEDYSNLSCRVFFKEFNLNQLGFEMKDLLALGTSRSKKGLES